MIAWQRGILMDGKEQSKSEANVPPVHAIPHQPDTP
jgi:hypothetical protein